MAEVVDEPGFQAFAVAFRQEDRASEVISPKDAQRFLPSPSTPLAITRSMLREPTLGRLTWCIWKPLVIAIPPLMSTHLAGKLQQAAPDVGRFDRRGRRTCDESGLPGTQDT